MEKKTEIRQEKKKAEKERKNPDVQDVDHAKGEEEKTEDTSFDFGGLPARDLKKNLGCG